MQDAGFRVKGLSPPRWRPSWILAQRLWAAPPEVDRTLPRV